MSKSEFGHIEELDRLPGGRRRFMARWYAGLTKNGTQKRPSKTFATRGEARMFLNKVAAQIGDDPSSRDRRHVTFDVLAKEWLSIHSEPNLTSHKDNLDRYRLHLQPFFRDCALSLITASRIQDLRAELQKKLVGPKKTKMSPNTVNRVLSLLQTILAFGHRRKYMIASPVAELGRGGLKLKIGKKKLLPPLANPEEAMRFLMAVRELAHGPRHRPLLTGESADRRGSGGGVRESTRTLFGYPDVFPLFATMLYTGVRRGEVVGLEWRRDVDFGRGVITVRKSYQGSTKSDKEREIPIFDELLPILKEHETNSQMRGSDLVFPAPDGGMYAPNAKLEKVLWAALDRAKIRRFRIHDLRHAFASLYMMAGGDLIKLQIMLGHSTFQLTCDTYVHFSPTHLAGDRDRLSFGTLPPRTVAVQSASILAFPPDLKKAENSQ